MANNPIEPHFRIGLTADFFTPDGKPKFGEMGLDILEASSNVSYYGLGELEPQITADQANEADGLVVLTPAVTAETVTDCNRLLAIGRFGVGYDAVDVTACTNADVVVFITAGAVDRSVAEATVGWMLALTHRMRVKDALARTGKWDERSKHMGVELRDRVFGTIGFGGIARKTIDLLRGFGMKRPLVYDPFMEEAIILQHDCQAVDLPKLLASADFVSIHCPLTTETRGMIGHEELALMKPTSYLINTARGGIVDEAALVGALSLAQIAGAAIDCFETEPLRDVHPLSKFDNVILAPHSIAWTDEMFRDIGRMVCQGMVDLAEGRRPHGVLNPEVFERPGFVQKWEHAQAAANKQVVSE